jgi:hypothetical protein
VCDRISLALTENAGIRDALNLFGSEDSRQFFSPSLAWRRTRVSKLLSLMQWPTPSENTNDAEASAANIFKPLPDDFRAKPQHGIWLLSRIAIWLVAVSVYGIWTYNYFRTHPFGWSEPQYSSDQWPWGAQESPAAMSDDGSTIALYNAWTQSVQVRDVRSGAVRASFPVDGPFQKLVRLNGSGDLLIVVPSYEQGRLYDVNARTDLGQLPDRNVKALEIVRIDGQDHVLSATDPGLGPGVVTLWRLAIDEGKTAKFDVKAKFEMAGRFVGLGVRADGTEFVTASDLSKDIDSPNFVIEVWNIDKKGIRARFGATFPNTDKVGLSSDGQWVAFNSIGRVVVAKLGASIKLHDLYNFRNFMANHRGNVAFAPHANVLISEYDVRTMDWSLALYGPPVGGDASADWPKKQLSAGRSGADELKWSSNGRVLFAADHNGSVALLSMPQGTLIKQFERDTAQALIVSSSLRYALTEHSGSVLRLWNLQENDNGKRKPMREYNFSGIKCAGVLKGADVILIRHKAGASRVALPEGNPESVEDPGGCDGGPNSRYVFGKNGFVDSNMQWTIPLSGALTEPTILSGPEQNDFWHPDYRILHRSEDGISFLTITSKTEKRVMALLAAIAAGLLVALVEAGFLIRRRYASPF